MDILARIAALIAPLAPALGLELLARFFAGLVLDRFDKSMDRADAIENLHARQLLLTRHMRALHMLLRIAEQLAALSVWMRAQAKLGRVHLRFHFHIPEMTVSPPPGAILARLESLARRFARMDEDADALVNQWGGVALIRLLRQSASAISLDSIGEGKAPAPASLSSSTHVEEVDRRVFAARRRGHPSQQAPRSNPTHKPEKPASQAPTGEIAGVCVSPAGDSPLRVTLAKLGGEGGVWQDSLK